MKAGLTFTKTFCSKKLKKQQFCARPDPDETNRCFCLSHAVQKADIALAPFQMSASRSSAVDFTKPFMTKGTTVVVRRPEQHIWVFQFLSPLSKVVWSAIFFAFAIVSLVLFGVSRVNSDR